MGGDGGLRGPLSCPTLDIAALTVGQLGLSGAVRTRLSLALQGWCWHGWVPMMGHSLRYCHGLTPASSSAPPSRLLTLPSEMGENGKGKREKTSGLQ